MDRPAWPILVLVLLVGMLVAGLAVDELAGALGPEEVRVTVIDERGNRLGSVDADVANTLRERYVGLSNTGSLDDTEGMLFVHRTEGSRTYVMRDMAFPIDIVFIDADRRITAVYHAEVKEPPLTRYEGRAKWVLEVPYRWTARHNVSVGDRVRIEEIPS